jgi:hypothetical protein
VAIEDIDAMEGDLNPQPLAKILKLFANPTAKNRHLPPPSVSGGHIHVGVVAPEVAGTRPWRGQVAMKC